MPSRQPRTEPTWVEFPSARRREAPGRAAEFSDLMTQFNELLTASLTESVSRLLGGMPVAQPRTPTKRYRRDCECEDDDCDPCEPDDCHCRCCIGDADLVVYARAGERRVVPVVISNCRRREREVNLELSQWTTRGGKPTQVTGQIVGQPKFTLEPCGDHTVLIVINAAVGDDPTGGTPDRLPDVDECLVLYADLRVEGCDIRPIRIALALLPFDCGAFEVDCGCTCC